MQHPLPDSLRTLLLAASSADSDSEWSGFLEEHSSLLLRVARSVSRGHDGVMDRYLYVLEALRRDGYQKLRAWSPEGHGRFETWLVVVARRLCFDFHRQRYGRQQSDSANAGDRHVERRNLADLVGDELDLSSVATSTENAPDQQLQRTELRARLKSAIDSLDLQDRLLLRLRFEDGLSVPEIAKLSHQPSPFGLYRRLNRILADVRRVLLASGIGGSTG